MCFSVSLLSTRLGGKCVLLQENRGGLHHSDEQPVQVVFQVLQLLALGLGVGLQANHKFDQVLPGLALELGENLGRDSLVLRRRRGTRFSAENHPSSTWRADACV